jgi:hypothetical protein
VDRLARDLLRQCTIGALLALGVSRAVDADAEPARWAGLDLPGACSAPRASRRSS